MAMRAAGGRCLGAGLLLFGLALGVNAVACGPRAFGSGWVAVASMAVAGAACVTVGIDLLRTARRIEKRLPPQ